MSKKEKMKKSKIVGQMTVFPFYRSERYFFVFFAGISIAIDAMEPCFSYKAKDQHEDNQCA